MSMPIPKQNDSRDSLILNAYISLQLLFPQSNSYTESAQPTPMDISQENMEADSLSCPESDSLLLPATSNSPLKTTTTTNGLVEELPCDDDVNISLSSSSAVRPCGIGGVDEELGALTIDVVEAWRIVAPPPPPHPPPQPRTTTKVDITRNPMRVGGNGGLCGGNGAHIN